MAILASIEVDDEGSLKIRNFRDALSDMGASVVQAKQQMAQANASGAQATKQQVDALTQLTAASRAYAQQQQQSIQGFSVLQSQVKAGTQVTQLQAAALQQLAAQTQTNTAFAAQYGSTVQALVGQMTAGAQVSQQMVAQLQQVASGYTKATQGAVQQATALDKLIASERALVATHQQSAQGFAILQAQMKAGTQVTQQQADALKQLAAQTQTNTAFTQKHGAALNDLVKQAQAGATVTPQLSKQINDLAAAHNKSSQGTVQHTSTLEKFSLQAAATAAAIGLMAAGLYAFLREAAEAAARIQTLGVVLNVVGKNAGITRVELQAQIEGVKALGITTREATDTVLQFVQSQLKVADATKIARAAQDLAVVAGENSSQTVKRLTQAIQTGETMLLRQVGIVTTNEQIWREYAKTIGKNVNQLDALDKKQAMVNKILTEAQKSAGAYEQSMDTAGKQLTSFARYTEEATLKLGEALVPVLGLAVKVATEFLKMFMALDPEMMKFISAALAAAAAMAVFSAAIAGAKLVATITLFQTLATNIGYVNMALANGIKLWPAIVGIFGPWGLAIAAVTVAIGALTAAYIYLNDTMDLSVDKEVAAAAAAASRIDTLRTTSEKIVQLGENTNKTKGEQELYNRALETLNKLAPGAASGLDGVSRSYENMLVVVEKNIQKQYELIRIQMKGLEIKKKEAQEQYDNAAASAQAADRELTEANKRLKEAQSGKQQFVSFTDFDGRVRHVATSVDGLKDAVKRAEQAVKDTAAALTPASTALATTVTTLEDLGNVLPENVLARGAKIAADVADALLVARQKYDNLDKRLKVAGKTKEWLTAVDVPTFQQRLTEVNNAWDKHTKQLETDAKKVAAATKAFYASIRDDDPVDMAKYKAASVLLKEVGEGTEEYARRVQKLRPILEAYAKSTDPAVKGITALQTAIDSLKTKTYEDALEKGVLANQKFAASLNDKLIEDMRQGLQQIVDLQEETNKKIFDARLAQQDRVDEVNREIAEQDAMRYMTDLEKAIYAEQKKFDAIERGYAREKLLRDRALEEERRAVDKKAALAQEEIKIFIEKTNREAELQLQLQRNRVGNMLPGVARDLAQEELRAAEKTREMDRETLRQYQQNQKARIESDRRAQQQILDQQQKVNSEIDKSNQELLGKQKAAMERAVNEIIKNWRGVGAAVKALGLTIAESFMNGLKEMGPGMKSFKDVLLGVFDSIKNAFLSMVNSMVQKWIEGLFKMKAADQANGLVAGGGKTGGGGFSLFGKGMSTGQKAMGGAAVGFMAGDIAGRYADGSYAKGALGGAASGAAAGAAVGGWVGAGVGAIAGGIAGFMQARAQRKQMQEDRDQLVKDMGGLEAFKKKAQEAGFAYEKLLSTKSPKEFGSEIKKLQEALDKLELKKSREELIKTSGGLLELSKSMELVGFDSRKLFNTTSVTEYNAEVEKLNELLAEQQKRLEALGQAATGLDTAAKGMAMRLDRALTDIGKKMGKAQADALEEAFKKAQEGGFKGTQNSFLLDQIKKAQAGGKDAPKLDPKTLEAFIKAQKDAQKEFNNLGLAATATFSAILQETGDIVQAMNAVGPALDQLLALSKEWGLESSGAFQKLLQLRQTITDNEDVVTSLSGITQIIKGLSEAGALTAEVFNAMGNDAATMFQTLLDRGVDTNTAMLLMQPTLQALWEAQKEFGFQTDEATQKLLDQAEAAGMVGAKQQSINKQMLDVLLLIAKALGADIPSAYDIMQQKAEDAAAGAEAGLGGVVDRAREAARAYRDMGDAAEDAGRRAEDSATGAAEGHSPTGIKQIIVRLKESQSEYDKFAESAVDAGKAAEDAATQAAAAAEAARNEHGFGPRQDHKPFEGRLERVEPAGNPEPAPAQPLPTSLTIQISPEFNINALDGADVERAVRETIGPELLNLALTNTDQFTILFEQALERYRRE